MGAAVGWVFYSILSWEFSLTLSRKDWHNLEGFSEVQEVLKSKTKAYRRDILDMTVNSQDFILSTLLSHLSVWTLWSFVTSVCHRPARTCLKVVLMRVLRCCLITWCPVHHTWKITLCLSACKMRNPSAIPAGLDLNFSSASLFFGYAFGQMRSFVCRVWLRLRHQP